MVHYLKDGENFGPSHFAALHPSFTGSARGAIPNSNQAEARGMPTGQRTRALDPEITGGSADGYPVEQREPLRRGGQPKLLAQESYGLKRGHSDRGPYVTDKGRGGTWMKGVGPRPGNETASRGPSGAGRFPGVDRDEAARGYDNDTDQFSRGGQARIKRADGGKAMAEGPPIRVNPMTRNADPNMRTSPGPDVNEVNAHRGGRIRRAVGGVIPGEAPAPIDQPMTRPQTPAPMGGNPLARATVTMPASDMSQLAAGAVKLGARTALNAAAMRGKAALQPRMGPAGNAPAATPPPPAPNTIPAGTRGMRGGGRVHRAIGGPMPGQMPQQVPQQMPQGAMAGGVPMQRPMPTAGAVPGAMPGMKGGGRIRRADGGDVEPYPQDIPPAQMQRLQSYQNRARQAEREGDYLPPRYRSNGQPTYSRADGSFYVPPIENTADHAKGGFISAKQRHALPKSDFALPGHGVGPEGKGAGSYPIDTPGRARNALARGAQHASPAELGTIKRRVHEKYPDIKEDRH